MAEPWTAVDDDDPNSIPPEGLRVELVVYVGPGIVWHRLVGTVRYAGSPGYDVPEGDWAPPKAHVDIHDGQPGSASYGVLSPATDWPTPPDAGRAWQWWRPLPVATTPTPSRGGR